MDQLKTQLAVVKQHSFWIMCLGILGVTIGSWWYSTGTLKSERVAQAGKIDAAQTSVSGIQTSQPQHPNAVTNAGMEALKVAYAQEVQKGWDLQYQRQEKILVWPENFTQPFHEAVDKLRPIESIPVTGAGVVPFAKDLAQALKEEYRNFIEEELQSFAKIIGTEWRAVATGTDASGAGAMGLGAMPGGYSGDGGVPGFPGGMQQTDAYGNPLGALDTSIVRWDPANQQELLNTHFGFIPLTRLPTTLEILYAQEDFWVLTNLMNIIKKTNGDATAHHEAAIKHLEFVRIGRSAAGQAGQINLLGMAPGAMTAGAMPTDGGMAMPSGDGAAPDMAATGSPDGGTAGATGDGYGVSLALRDPAEGRYVDDKYQPLTAARLRGALTSTAPEDAMLAVAKRMPVRIRVWIDQRRLNLLIAECGNSELPVEVRQVRINRPPAAPGAMGMGGMGGMSGDGGYGGGMGGMGGMGGTGFGGGMGSADSGYGGGGSGFGGTPSGGMGMPGGGMPGSGDGGYGGGMSPGTRSVTQDAAIDPNLIPVELYGIVYIYNPANKTQLGLDKPPEAPPTDGVPPTDVTAPPTDVTAPPVDNTTPPAAPMPVPTPMGTEVTSVQQ
jgi:hypothetical protein